MATTTPVTKVNDPSKSDNSQNGDQTHGSMPSIIRSAERIIMPTQPNTELKGGLASNSGVPSLIALKSAVLQQSLGHPFSYVRVLMQMGFEPLPAYRGRTLFGKEALYYPHVFRYLKHIYTTDGFVGLYRGFGCSLLTKVVCWYTTTQFNEAAGLANSQTSTDQTNASWNKCIEKILTEVQSQSWGILVSHPFHVMAIRCMGQFVGREKAYSSINIFKNIQEIYDHQGIGGFFVGFLPRWLLETSLVIMTNVLIHLLKTYLSSQGEMTSLYEYMATFIAQTVTYPLNVVTTVTAINGSGLRAGMLPMTPIYADWHHAYNYLKKTEQLKRGSSFFNRIVLGSERPSNN